MTHAEKRDDGSDAPGSDPTDRPAGTVDEDTNPLSDPELDTEYGGTGTLPPKDTDAAVPANEGHVITA
jgi:hypothetical protein